MSNSQLDYEHLREKQKGKHLADRAELKERERSFEEQKELLRRLNAEVEERHKQLQLLNNELKSKQGLLKRMQTPGGQPRQGTNANLENEISARDKQIDLLNDRVVVLDHELRELRGLRDSLDALKSLEQGNDGLLNRAEARKKDQVIAELRRKAMAQEEAIGKWIEALDQKNALLKARDEQLAQLQGLNDRLHLQLEEASGKVDELD